MLVVGLYGDTHIGAGRGGCTDIEYRTHMSLWCIQASPLMVACDVRAMNDPTREILVYREIIAVDQDSLCATSGPIRISGCITSV
jgi:alpha-galactosidase